MKPNIIKLTVIKDLYFYEVPTLIFCQDERQSNFIFVLLDEDKLEYVGKKVNVEDVSLFLEGQMDLKPLFENTGTNFYIGSYGNKGEFNAVLFQGIYSDDLLPEEGLMLLSKESDLASTIKKDIVNRMLNGSSKSNVGKLERVTQNRVVALFYNELKYRYLGNWEEREDNRNIEEDILTAWLTKKRYSQNLIGKALYRSEERRVGK